MRKTLFFLLLSVMVASARPLAAQSEPSPAGGGIGESPAAKPETPAPPPASTATPPSEPPAETPKKAPESGTATGVPEGSPARTRFDDKEPIRRQTNAGNTAGTTPVERNKNADGYDPSSDIVRLAVGLGIFVLIVVAIVWYMRRSPRMKKYFTGGPIKVLARNYLAPKYAVYLVKVGERVLVVGQGPDSLHTLTEISDKDEVTRLLADIETNTNPNSMTNTFRGVLNSMSSKKGAAAAPRVSAQTARPAAGHVDVRADAPVTTDGAGDVGNAADPSYSSQAKLATLRAQLEQAKARLKS